MTEPLPCRLLIDLPLSGLRNMAIDEVLLNSGRQGLATLRFYQWARPTVSLGHFQAAQGQFVPERFHGLDVVRRLSGGGAILHDRELTYSCVLPNSHPLTLDPIQIYDAVHAGIIQGMKTFGVSCRFRGDEAFADQSFLCFSRGDERDLLIGNQKIVGSAQRRRQGTILQHGSILLSRSDQAPEFPGILELAGTAVTAEDLIPVLTREWAERLNLALTPGTLTADELQAVEQRAK